jgi:hypothetical protein
VDPVLPLKICWLPPTTPFTDEFGGRKFAATDLMNELVVERDIHVEFNLYVLTFDDLIF